MMTSECPRCAHPHHWRWEEAFDKFGFNDGDGLVMTGRVVAALRKGGYRVHAQMWGMHNTVILSIRRGRRQLIPETAEVGYDDPRSYLLEEIVALLDEAFSGGEEVFP